MSAATTAITARPVLAGKRVRAAKTVRCVPPDGKSPEINPRKRTSKSVPRPDPDRAPDATFARFVRGISSIDAFVSSNAVCTGIWRLLIGRARSRRRWPRRRLRADGKDILRQRGDARVHETTLGTPTRLLAPSRP